jgi:hypothetical protein
VHRCYPDGSVSIASRPSAGLGEPRAHERPRCYVSHATATDYRAELYAPLRASELARRYQLVLPHEHRDAPRHTRELVRGCALVLAEVSAPATGQGIELGWADAFGVPVLAVHRADAPVSRSVALIARAVVAYAPGGLAAAALHALAAAPWASG